MARCHINPTVKLMEQALRMDLDEVKQNYRSVPSRLVGRLIGHESKDVDVLGTSERAEEVGGASRGLVRELPYSKTKPI